MILYEQLEGNNIVLRKAMNKDYQSMLYNVWGDESVWEYMLFKPVYTLEDAKERCKWSYNYQQENYAYFVALKDNDEAIGLCGIKEYEQGHFEEIGICIGKEYHNRGLGKEIVSLLLELAFDKLDAIDFKYGCFQDNIISRKLVEHFGFHYEYTYSIERPWDKSKKTIDSFLLTQKEYYSNLSRISSFRYT